jgi:hypothetical protein
MGKLTYGGSSIIEIDDRALAHIRVVTMAKLRRNEPFPFTWENKSTGMPVTTTIWIHPAVPIQFDFYGKREPVLNRAWIEELVLTANTQFGLRLTAEPANSLQ